MKKALVIIASIIFIVLISLCIAWGAEYHLKGPDRRAQGYAVHHEVLRELLCPDVCEAV